MQTLEATRKPARNISCNHVRLVTKYSHFIYIKFIDNFSMFFVFVLQTERCFKIVIFCLKAKSITIRYLNNNGLLMCIFYTFQNTVSQIIIVFINGKMFFVNVNGFYDLETFLSAIGFMVYLCIVRQKLSNSITVLMVNVDVMSNRNLFR